MTDSAPADKADVITLDEARRSRRDALKDGLAQAKEKLAPANLAHALKDEQKEKLIAAGRKAGQTVKDNKVAVAAGGAGVLAAVAAGLFFWRKQKQSAAVTTPAETETV